MINLDLASDISRYCKLCRRVDFVRDSITLTTSLKHVQTLVGEQVRISRTRQRRTDFNCRRRRLRRRRPCRQFHVSNGPSPLSRVAKRVELIK